MNAHCAAYAPRKPLAARLARQQDSSRNFKKSLNRLLTGMNAHSARCGLNYQRGNSEDYQFSELIARMKIDTRRMSVYARLQAPPRRKPGNCPSSSFATG